MDYRGYTCHFERAAAVASPQPGDLCSHRNAADHSRDADARYRNVNGMNIDYPFRLDVRGRTAATTDPDHIRDMIEQLLFTNPGERVNQPDFGSGLLQLVFAPNSVELASALQFAMQAAVQRYLGDVIDVRQLQLLAEDATLSVSLSYAIRATNDQRTDVFVRNAP
jgi:phage baseplate assembly protein W